VYDATVRSLVLACLLLAGVAHADSRIDRMYAERKCAARDPACDWLATLSSLERQSVSRAIAARGYTVEPAPWGKVIARVHVYNEDVFAEKTPVLGFFNRFHVTTRESAIRPELRIGVGEVWDQDRVDETSRKLRDPLWTSVVVVIPVVSQEPGKVDMLVVTRDIWSLRLNTQYTFQQGSLTDLSIAISENNFLGTRSLFALGVQMDQGAIATGPVFLDKNVNVLGHKLSVAARFDLIYNRQNLQEKLGFSEGPPTLSETDTPGFTREGTQSTFRIDKPLFSLTSKWGAGLSFGHRYAIDRRFRGLGLLPVDCSTGTCQIPTRTIVDAEGNESRVFAPILDLARVSTDAAIIGVQYEMRRWDLTASAVRQWGGCVAGDCYKHTVSFGYSIDDTNPRLLPSFPGNAVEREAFIRDVLPRDEMTSTPFVTYGLFMPRFKNVRNIDTFELAETITLGPSLSLSLSTSPKFLGSTNSFSRASGSISWSFPWCRDGFVRPSASIATRYQDLERDGDREFIDNTATFGLSLITPTYKWARIVSSTTVATRWNPSVSSALGAFSIGSNNGLRGFEIGEFRGERLIRNQVELRTVPVPFWVVRLGAVAFYEVGGAANTLLTTKSGNPGIQLHQDVGFGVRMLIPQTARDLFRFDFAFPLDGRDPGSLHFIAGFDTAF
jgi:hypothetical protein